MKCLICNCFQIVNALYESCDHERQVAQGCLQFDRDTMDGKTPPVSRMRSSAAGRARAIPNAATLRQQPPTLARVPGRLR